MAAVTARMADSRVGPISIQESGSGRPLVYLHSAMGEGVGLEMVGYLGERFGVTAPMFCGFGDSAGIEQIDDIEDASFHLLDLLERLGCWDEGSRPPILMGLSLGGWMAAEFATRWPERVGGLVLVNPAGLYLRGAEIADIFGRPPSEMAADLFADPEHPIAQMMRMMETSFANLTAGQEIPFELIKPQIQAMTATARIAWNPYLHNPKLPGRLSRIDCPTLVVRGEHDSLIPAPHCRAYADAIAGARHETMTGVAHMIPLEQPEALAGLVAGFFA